MATTTRKLTAAAKRDLMAINRGYRPALRYGPYTQLIAAGYISGPQDTWQITESHRRHLDALRNES